MSETCEHPEKAVQFLNLLYSDSEIVNLLAYGVEDTHYEKKPDGTIGYPDGFSSSNIGYLNDAPWVLPNQFIEYIWEGNDPKLREKMRDYCDSAKESESLYFKLDSSAFNTELNVLNEIANQYAYGLETGQIDPDVYLPRMLEEMKGAGVDATIQKIQEQYDYYVLSTINSPT
jgi:putative aldouronate transport system substrate-binding protein